MKLTAGLGSGNEAGTGGLVTFKDSNWLMSIVLAHQPHWRRDYKLSPIRAADPEVVTSGSLVQP